MLTPRSSPGLAALPFHTGLDSYTAAAARDVHYIGALIPLYSPLKLKLLLLQRDAPEPR